MSKTKSNLTIFQRIALELLWLLCRFIGILPHWFRYYVLSEIIFFLVYRCLRYRVKVVTMNLRNSFPEKSEKEIIGIRRRFYVIMSEIMVSTISLAGGRAKNVIVHQPQVGNGLEGLKEATKDSSWVALTAHFGLWEYFMFWAKYADQSLIAVYHPLASPLFEELFRRFRNVDNVVTVPLKEAMRYCLEHRDGVEGRNFVLGLIADQNPPRRPNSEWFTFLNQDSIFFDGGEKIARKLSLPVFFVYQRRIRRGVYELDYTPIYDGVEDIEEGVITRRYVENLEKVICENPQMWLWSHRRWKHIH